MLESVGQASPVALLSVKYPVKADIKFIFRMNLESKVKQQYRVIHYLNSICAATCSDVSSMVSHFDFVASLYPIWIFIIVIDF